MVHFFNLTCVVGHPTKHLSVALDLCFVSKGLAGILGITAQGNASIERYLCLARTRRFVAAKAHGSVVERPIGAETLGEQNAYQITQIEFIGTVFQSTPSHGLTVARCRHSTSTCANVSMIIRLFDEASSLTACPSRMPKSCARALSALDILSLCSSDTSSHVAPKASLHVFAGYHKYAIMRLHDEYGLAVRIAPNELSYIDPRAYQDIYGKLAHESEAAALEKEPDFFAPAFNSSDSLVDANSRDYKPQKKTAIRAFSQGSLLRRSHVMTPYVDSGIKRLSEYLNDNNRATADVNSWIGNMVLDMQGELTLSHNFEAVKLGSVQHSMVSNMHRAVTVIQYCTQLQYLPDWLLVLWRLFPSRDVFAVVGSVPPLGPALTHRLSDEPESKGEQDFGTLNRASTSCVRAGITN
nr:cytochrome p450 monooxygenase dtxs2 [Quercus suber]